MTNAIEQLIKMHDPRCVSAESMNIGRGRASLSRTQFAATHLLYIFLTLFLISSAK